MWWAAPPSCSGQYPKPGRCSLDRTELPVDVTGVLAVVDRDRIRAAVDDLWPIKVVVVDDSADGHEGWADHLEMRPSRRGTTGRGDLGRDVRREPDASYRNRPPQESQACIRMGVGKARGRRGRFIAVCLLAGGSAAGGDHKPEHTQNRETYHPNAKQDVHRRSTPPPMA